MCDDSAITVCNVPSSSVNGVIQRPLRPADRCCSDEPGCSPMSVVGSECTHASSDCRSGTAGIHSTTPQCEALPLSACEVFHAFCVECIAGSQCQY